jgi:23S rRNA pseudouridine2605 synthase
MPQRLNKRIAASGAASRRKADELIASGKVKVNGIVTSAMGTVVEDTDEITIDDKLLATPEEVTYLLYKPRGVVTSSAQQGSDEIITHLVPEFPVVYPVGRLDKDSEGLILLTNNGALADKLTHPKYEHSKQYTVIGYNRGFMSQNQIKTQLTQGVTLEDGIAKVDRITITEGKNGILILVITVHEGRHHLIRRLCKAVDVSVEQLIRTRLSILQIGNLEPGKWRKLSAAELKELV